MIVRERRAPSHPGFPADAARKADGPVLDTEHQIVGRDAYDLALGPGGSSSSSSARASTNSVGPPVLFGEEAVAVAARHQALLRPEARVVRPAGMPAPTRPSHHPCIVHRPLSAAAGVGSWARAGFPNTSSTQGPASRPCPAAFRRRPRARPPFMITRQRQLPCRPPRGTGPPEGPVTSRLAPRVPLAMPNDEADMSALANMLAGGGAFSRSRCSASGPPHRAPPRSRASRWSED